MTRNVNHIVHHKNFSSDHFELTVPEKTKSGKRYFSYGSRDKADIFVQTPSSTVTGVDTDGDGTIRISVPADSAFAKTLSDLDEYIKDYIAERTETFFNGKRFSRQKIHDSYEPTVCDDAVVLKCTSDGLQVRDQKGNRISLDDVKEGHEVVVIMHVHGVSFTSTRIKLDLVARQIKAYVKSELPDWCITADSDSEKETAPQEQKQTDTDIVHESNPETLSEEIQNLERPEKENDDDQNLF